ncbi:unnamed protein product, partial [Didymodactylos carnosus]
SIRSKSDFPKLFISYSHKDKEICETIVNELKKEKNLKVWFDTDKVKDYVIEDITAGVKQSDRILLMLSDHYVKSDYCRREVKFSESHNKILMPCIIQKNFRVTNYDWLNFILEDKFVYSFHKDNPPYTLTLTRLISHINDTNNNEIDNTSLTVDSPNTSISVTINKKRTSNYLMKHLAAWNSTDIWEWCMDNKLDNWTKSLRHYDGEALLELSKLINKDRKLKNICLNSQINVFDVALFKSAMKKIQLKNDNNNQA